MSATVNALGQPIGNPLPDWSPRPRPSRNPMVGRYCRVEPLEVARHAEQLYAANGLDREARNWTYLSAEPPADFPAYRNWLTAMAATEDPLFHAIIDQATDRAVGLAAFMRINPTHGVMEVGHLNFSPALQRRRAATEAMYLMMRRAFSELGYRRYEWKCDSLNQPSQAAAKRLGFQFEGLFRQAVVYKGRNRDSAWFSILDGEWPRLQAGFERWLAPTNFDTKGSQRQGLATLMAQS